MLFLFLPVFAVAQDDLGTITKALDTGDVDALSTHFSESVELAILEEEGVYNQSQAVQKVRRFMGQTKVQSFTQVHNGASRSTDSQYVIGDLVTGSGTFRVYLYLTNNNGKLLIEEFRFDSE